jgi:hypothetical protein
MDFASKEVTVCTVTFPAHDVAGIFSSRVSNSPPPPPPPPPPTHTRTLSYTRCGFFFVCLGARFFLDLACLTPPVSHDVTLFFFGLTDPNFSNRACHIHPTYHMWHVFLFMFDPAEATRKTTEAHSVGESRHAPFVFLLKKS